jgi:hypothetical protein
MFYQRHAEELAELSGDLAAVWSKLEETAARLALVHYLARWAGGECIDATTLDVSSMRAGIELARWFGREAKRIYCILDETDDDRALRRLLEFIGRRGGSVTAREVQQGCRWLKEPGAAEAALNELVKHGHGFWELTPPGQRGQPTRKFQMSTVSTVYGNVKNHGKNTNTVDVDAVDSSKTQTADGDLEWV